MGMFEHRQAFAAVELHGKLGAEVVETFVLLHRGKNLLRQRTRVDQHQPVDPGARAEHQVTHIIASRALRPQACGQQRIDQCRLFVANSANLQIGAIGRLNHPTGMLLGSISHSDRLPCLDGATTEFDPADTTVQCLDDPQQPGTSRRAQKGACLMWIHRMTGTR